jgi:hypothetical protein
VNANFAQFVLYKKITKEEEEKGGGHLWNHQTRFK